MKYGKEEYRKEAMKKHKSHWEMDVSDSIFPKANPNNPLDAWTPKNVKDWPCTHVKINECDN